MIFPVVNMLRELYRKEGGVLKNWCLWTMVLEKTPESPLDSKKIKTVNLKGNQPWILIGRTDVEAETPGFWSSDANSWLIEKAPDAGKDGGQKEKRTSEDEMVGWHHWCNRHKRGQALGDGEGQRSGVLQSMGLQRVEWRQRNNSNDWSFGLPRQLGGEESAWQCRRWRFNPWVRKIRWRRKWQPTPVFLPEKSHGQRSLLGYCPQGHQWVGYNWAAKQQLKLYIPEVRCPIPLSPAPKSSPFHSYFNEFVSFFKPLLNLLQYCLCFLWGVFLLFCFGYEACWFLAPQPEIEPAPPALEGKVLSSGPAGKSWIWLF